MKFVDASGVLRKARRFVSSGASVQDDEVKSPAKLAALIRQIQARVGDLEAAAPPEASEFEVVVGGSGAITSISHNMSSPIRWYVVQWTQAGGVAKPVDGPSLVQDASSTSRVLALRSYTPGRAIVRVEPAFADIDPGITVTGSLCPRFVALTADLTNAGAGAYVDMLVGTVDTVAASSTLVVQFASSFGKTLAAGMAYFVVTVDGVVVADGSYVDIALGAAGVAVLQVSAPVTAGTHTVKVRWASVPNSLVCRPATVANEFASMYIQEIP